MEPASTIISNLGGPSEVARITGVHRTRVYKWQSAKSLGGTGGIIPFKYAPALIAAAKDKEVTLEAADFLPVTEAAE